jgi:hypothetical protein
MADGSPIVCSVDVILWLLSLHGLNSDCTGAPPLTWPMILCRYGSWRNEPLRHWIGRGGQGSSTLLIPNSNSQKGGRVVYRVNRKSK